MLGIIGGMGPLASSLFYDMIIKKTGAKTDQENLDLILLSHSSMPDRTAAILSGEEEKINQVRDKLYADAKFLEEAGCRALVVTCNTAHFFIDMVEEEVGVPFIHLIRETAKEIKRKEPGKKIAVLATDGTIKTKLYQKEIEKQGLEVYIPGEEIQKKVMSEIYDFVKAGKPADEKIWREIEEDLEKAGCEGGVLACTELSVVKTELGLGEFYYDPMEIAADRALEFFKGDKE